MKILLPALVSVAAMISQVWAGEEAFHPGGLIPDFGRVAPIADARLGPQTEMKIAYDIAEAGSEDAINRRIETAARFLNMHFDAGVPAENMKVAIVVHGKASSDLLTAGARGATNPNEALIAALIEQGVTIELCGQSAAYYDIAAEDLLPGVTMALSAMTAHVLLQQQGYALNPF
ncbi:DsrE family protein [Aquisalinus flavus]|uniref:Intracellular sulfur oxidation DsrE/DsrF family protein n=1 Tax=Aquisalinus flavus TaxID=1526572 RepID=A0A8J2V6Z6_9PROT|nr:DsrE family protein [Aquisalinus flavus]MBD0427166.1 DsrE family protein [Aquisalinus flavus]UNE46983.1 hypothetical protein FF099_02385 [Aquisalinus flavus]GGC98879.1 hypothetical protein GCM10011342_04790 [Aquisalinus flavus]